MRGQKQEVRQRGGESLKEAGIGKDMIKLLDRKENKTIFFTKLSSEAVSLLFINTSTTEIINCLHLT